MDIILKIGLLSLERQWGLLALNNKCKNNVIKKTKIRSIMNSCCCIQSVQHRHGCPGSEVVVKQIFNLDHFAKICSLKICSWSHVQSNLVKSRRFYRFFRNRNVILIYFLFLQILSSKNAFSLTLLLKACVVSGWKTMSFQDFFFAVNFIGSKTLKHNVLDLTEFRNLYRNQVYYRKFLRE